jgi:hypothetical protein
LREHLHHRQQRVESFVLVCANLSAGDTLVVFLS